MQKSLSILKQKLNNTTITVDNLMTKKYIPSYFYLSTQIVCNLHTWLIPEQPYVQIGQKTKQQFKALVH